MREYNVPPRNLGGQSGSMSRHCELDERCKYYQQRTITRMGGTVGRVDPYWSKSGVMKTERLFSQRGGVVLVGELVSLTLVRQLALGCESD